MNVGLLYKIEDTFLTNYLPPNLSVYLNWTVLDNDSVLPLLELLHRILLADHRMATWLWPKHTSGRWSLATCIGQPARLQHFEHHATNVLVGQ